MYKGKHVPSIQESYILSAKISNAGQHCPIIDIYIYIVAFRMDVCPHFFSPSTAVRIKKLILQKLLGVLNNLGLDPVGHFEAPWWPFLIL